MKSATKSAAAKRTAKATRKAPRRKARFQPAAKRAGQFVAVVDNTTGLMWSRASSSESMTHAAAEEYCKNLRTGGFSDWRLPTVEELFLLADRSRFRPAIDTDAFPDTKSDWYWTASPDASDPAYAWFVSFYNGDASINHRDYDAFVRAVRSVAPARASQFSASRS